jgi:hypothetical protein
MKTRKYLHPLISLALSAGIGVGQALYASAAGASTLLSENFDDGGGINSVFNFTNSSGQVPTMRGGGPTGNYARLTNLSTANINSLAFDLAPGSLGPEFTVFVDFRMTSDADAAAAGNPFPQAADGLGIGLFDTSLFPATGPVNPLNIWEDPRVDAPAGSVMMGFDIFSFTAFGGNNVRMTGLSGGDELLADLTVPFSLNQNVFHQAQWSFTDVGTNALMSLTLVQDVNGIAIVHNLLSGILVPGLDLDTFSGRLVLGGRTGAGFANGDVDNIRIEAVPIPPAALLLFSGLVGLIMVGRRDSRMSTV